MNSKIIIFLFAIVSSTIANSLAQVDSTQFLLDSLNKAYDLDEVTIKARKPPFTVQNGKFVFNYDNNALIHGNSTWELLEAIPILNPEENGNIKLMGFQNATVFINDRKTVLTGRDLQSYLKTIPADNIKSIEVITNPSSKYDGSSGGIINVVLKRQETDGMKGSITLSDQQRTYNSPEANIFLNYHRNKFTQLINLSLGQTVDRDFQELDNTYFQSGIVENISNDARNEDFNWGGSTTLEYELNDKHKIGGLLEFYRNEQVDDRAGRNRSFINSILDEDYRITNVISRNSSILGGNLSYAYKNPDKKNGLFVDLDYVRFTTPEENAYTSFLSENTNTVLEGIRTNTDQSVENRAVRVDYYQPIAKKVEIEIGGKYSNNISNNPFMSSTWANEEWQEMLGSSNEFEYKEQISAAYITFLTQLSRRWKLNFGARYEHTQTQIREKKDGPRIDNQYDNLLPNLELNGRVGKRNMLSLSLSQSITRPGYTQLNPFVFNTNNNFLFSGNPDLTVSTWTTIGLQYVVNRQYVFFVRQMFLDNMIIENQLTNAEGEVISQPFNIDGLLSATIVGSMIRKMFFDDKLSMNFSNMVNFINQDIDDPNFAETSRSNVLYQGTLNLTLREISRLKLDINTRFFFRTGFKALNENNRYRMRGTVNISRKIPKWDASIGLNFNDPFYLYNYDFSRINETGIYQRNAIVDRGARLSFTKRFGNKKAKQIREKNSDRTRLEREPTKIF